MTRLELATLAVLVAGCSASAADRLPKPDRIPADPTPEQAALVREGVALHDQRNYEGAIAKYQQVLAENPWEVHALYELAYSYFANGDYQASLDTARLGAQCKSGSLPGFYAMIGNALDELGKGEEAIETYQAAIKLDPRMGKLHYNLAVSLRRAGRQAEAKEAAQSALRWDPNHSSSHLLLASIYRHLGYRVPAILAYSRFLILEPQSSRATDAIPTLRDLLTKGVGKGKGPKDVTITISETPKNRKDEGDFTTVELMMSMAVVADLSPGPEKAKEEPKSEMQKLVSIYNSIGEGLELMKPGRGFAPSYYAPYFAALTKAGHTEAFIACTWKKGNIEGAAEWAEANLAKIEAFLAWSKDYQWPSK
jgi:tetratricopeptide (TPR) repeat protein